MDELKRSVQPWFSTPTTEELKNSEIKIGREKNPLEEEFNYYLERACLDLGIMKPGLEIIPEELGYFAYNDKNNTIYVALRIKKVSDIFFQTRIRKQINSELNHNKILFIFFHEIGHAWHFNKHKSHWDTFKDNYKSCWDNDLEQYMTQQSERIADQIAVILFKRYGLG